MNVPTAAYIHIPFCRRRCFYCDFPVTVLGDRTDIHTSSLIADYVTLLLQEINLTPNLGKPLKTIFFGGGTPSLLPVKFLEQILATLAQKFSILPDAEISLEMDPATFTLAQGRDYRKVGVNRVSLGVQAFQDHLLALAGRFHRQKDIYEAIASLQDSGFTNLSLDLISGLPQQTLEDRQISLETALKLQPTHLSCYDLVLEAVTPFGKQYQPGEKPLPDDLTTAQMYRLAQNLLTEAGYEHYEISNYAQPGSQCQHNRVYWQNLPYYGFGMGATSYTNNQRVTRPRKRREYALWVETLAQNSGILPDEPTTYQDQLLETLMLGLRLREGLDLEAIAQKFGTKVMQKLPRLLQPFAEKGWVNDSHPARIALSDPEGFLFSNTILARLFAELS